MMKMLLVLGMSWALGSTLGWVYFQALWNAVQRLPRRQRPGIWMALSLLARLALVLTGFTLLVRWGGWSALLAALAGFLLARAVMVRRIRAVAPAPQSKP